MKNKNKKSRKNPELSGLEIELMNEIWNLKTVTAAEIKAHLKRNLADTTIHTVLTHLHKKGYIEQIPTTERAKRFKPLIAREKVAQRSLTKLIASLFRGSPAEAMLHLVQSEEIDEQQLKEIKTILDSKIDQEKGETS